MSSASPAMVNAVRSRLDQLTKELMKEAGEDSPSRRTRAIHVSLMTVLRRESHSNLQAFMKEIRSRSTNHRPLTYGFDCEDSQTASPLYQRIMGRAIDGLR
jgi:hypothetical protein